MRLMKVASGVPTLPWGITAGGDSSGSWLSSAHGRLLEPEVLAGEERREVDEARAQHLKCLQIMTQNRTSPTSIKV